MESIPPFHGVIYFIHNMVNGGVYIGQTIMDPMKRWSVHRNYLRNGKVGNPYFQRAWNKYGEAAFEFVVIEEHSSLEALNEAEQFYISYLRSIGARVYNARKGGGNGGALTPEARQRRFGRKASEAARANMRGRKWTEAQRAKAIPHMRGRKCSAETIERMKAGRVGFRHSEETRQRMGKSRIGKSQSHRMSYFRSPEGEIVSTDCLKTMADTYGLNKSHLSNLIYGRRKQYRGWVFLYAEDLA